MEKSLNVQLFDRIGKEIILTPHGERLYQWALKLLLLKDQALMDVKQGVMELRGMIRIAASSVPGQFLIPKMIKQFRDKYPNTTFQINQSSSKLAMEKVHHGNADFGITGEKYESDRLHYIPLLKEKLVLATSNHIVLTGPVDIHDILKYPFVMRNSDSGTNTILEKFLKKNKISKDKMKIAAYTDSSQSLMQFVMQDIGISIISELAAKEYAAQNMIKMHEIYGFDEERYFYLVYNRHKTQSILSKLFIESAIELLS